MAPRVQERVKMWMNYTWSQQKSFDETEESNTCTLQFESLTSMHLILLDRRSMNLLVGFFFSKSHFRQYLNSTPFSLLSQVPYNPLMFER